MQINTLFSIYFFIKLVVLADISYICLNNLLIYLKQVDSELILYTSKMLLVYYCLFKF